MRNALQTITWKTARTAGLAASIAAAIAATSFADGPVVSAKAALTFTDLVSDYVNQGFTATLRHYTMTGTLDLTNFPQANPNPNSLALPSDATFEIQLGQTYDFSASFTSDPNLDSDLGKDLVVLHGAPFAASTLFDSMGLPIVFAKGWRDNDPTSTLKLRLTGPHGKKATGFSITLDVYGRTVTNQQTNATETQGIFPDFGLGDIAVRSVPITVPVTIKFGDTFFGGVISILSITGPGRVTVVKLPAKLPVKGGIKNETQKISLKGKTPP